MAVGPKLKQNANKGCDSCASLAGLVLKFYCTFYFSCDRSFTFAVRSPPSLVAVNEVRRTVGAGARGPERLPPGVPSTLTAGTRRHSVLLAGAPAVVGSSNKRVKQSTKNTLAGELVPENRQTRQPQIHSGGSPAPFGKRYSRASCR